MMLSHHRKRTVTRGPGCRFTSSRLACFVGIAALCIAGVADMTPLAAAQGQAPSAPMCHADYKMINKKLALRKIDDCSILLARPGLSAFELIEAHKRRWTQYLYLKRYPEAIADLTVVINAEPRNAKHYFWRADLYARIDMRPEAISDYRKSLQINPSLKESQEGLKKLGVNP